MNHRTIPFVVTTRAEALVLLGAIRLGVPDDELAPFAQAMLTYDAEQSFAIMRGTGNALSPSEELAILLVEAGLLGVDETVAAGIARVTTGAAA